MLIDAIPSQDGLLPLFVAQGTLFDLALNPVQRSTAAGAAMDAVVHFDSELPRAVLSTATLRLTNTMRVYQVVFSEPVLYFVPDTVTVRGEGASLRVRGSVFACVYVCWGGGLLVCQHCCGGSVVPLWATVCLKKGTSRNQALCKRWVYSLSPFARVSALMPYRSWGSCGVLRGALSLALALVLVQAAFLALCAASTTPRSTSR